MANYYTHYSFAFSLPNKEAQDYALNLATRLRTARDDEEWEADDVREFKDWLQDWSPGDIEADGSDSPGLWIHSDESGDPYCAAMFTKHLLAKFMPKECVEFQWSSDCSKPRLDAFGGGAYFITAGSIESLFTGDWLAEKRRAFSPEPVTAD